MISETSQRYAREDLKVRDGTVVVHFASLQAVYKGLQTGERNVNRSLDLLSSIGINCALSICMSLCYKCGARRGLQSKRLESLDLAIRLNVLAVNHRHHHCIQNDHQSESNKNEHVSIRVLISLYSSHPISSYSCDNFVLTCVHVSRPH